MSSCQTSSRQKLRTLDRSRAPASTFWGFPTPVHKPRGAMHRLFSFCSSTSALETQADSQTKLRPYSASPRNRSSRGAAVAP